MSRVPPHSDTCPHSFWVCRDCWSLLSLSGSLCRKPNTSSWAHAQSFYTVYAISDRWSVKVLSLFAALCWIKTQFNRDSTTANWVYCLMEVMGGMDVAALWTQWSFWNSCNLLRWTWTRSCLGLWDCHIVITALELVVPAGIFFWPYFGKMTLHI